MKPIITLTINPSVDVAFQADEVVPVRKIRTDSPRFDPGGGGINVSRVIKELGGETIAVHTAGWLTGHFLEEMLDELGLDRCGIEIEGRTRASNVCFERITGHEYRFTPEGPEIKESEWQACLDRLGEFDADYIVCSGSLAPGVPNDFYGRVADVAALKGARVVLDTSGAPLFHAIEHGVYLVKPNQRELQHLVGQKASSLSELKDLASQLVADGKVEIVALTLGADGALLVSREATKHLQSPKVEVRSAVGAGDSFVAAMTLALAQGRPLIEAFAYGVATGAATVLTLGTELCRKQDVERLYEEICAEQLVG
jgi:6-phosphofructokinase 2